MKIAIDAGYNQTKIYTGSRQGVILSAIAEPNALNLSDVGAGAKRYTINGKEMIVGAAALGPGLKQKNARSLNSLLESLPYLALCACDEISVTPGDVSILSTGLPLADIGSSNAVIAALQPLFPSAKIVVNSQAVGALISYAMDNASTINPDDQGLVLDIGGNTVLTLGHIGYRPTGDGSHQFDRMGVLSCADLLAKRLEPQLKTLISAIKASQALRDGVIRGGGLGRQNIESEVHAAQHAYTDMLLTMIRETYGDYIADLDNIIICGGGANLIKNHIPAEWRNIAKFSADPEFANARGYFALAQ